MGDNGNNDRIRFGVFELDPRTRELRRNGTLVKLQDQPFQVLLALTGKAGELVTREELAKKIWPDDTFVDFDVGLSRAVNKLRDALGDTAENPRFIQTLPKRGYRFIAPVDGGECVPPPTEIPAKKHMRPRWLLAALGVLPLAAVGGWLLWQRVQLQTPPPRVRVLTSYSGFEYRSAFSPDGGQVAFVWGGPNTDNWDIYVKQVGIENALRLTSDTADDLGPAWSPDGKRIAFLRSGAGLTTAVYLISPLGGDERKLVDVPRAVGPLSWSHDGKWLAFARWQGEAAGIYLLPVEGGEPRRITFPKAPAYDEYPVISDDGRRLVYGSCTRNFACDLFVQELDSTYAPRGKPHQITRQQLNFRGIAWANDSLVYSGSLSWGVLHYLWRVKVDGERDPERLDIAGVHASFPAFSPHRRQLVFSKSVENYDIWRYQINGSLAPLIKSSLGEARPQFSPDGQRIAFATSRSGESYDIWVADADGSSPKQITSQFGRGAGSPKWSPDGRWIVFDSQRSDGGIDICVVDSSGGRPRRLDLGPYLNALPVYSHDAKWIYFTSDRTGREEIWRVPAAGGQPEQMTENGGFFAAESADGKTLFYTKVRFHGPLFARPLSGGSERKILDYVGVCQDFVAFQDGIYYCGQLKDGQIPLLFHEFSTGVRRSITSIEPVVTNGLSVSPDRKSILISRSASTGSDLMIIENFR
jgi:Tol biopolymer transport system component/DNA-binding winged helix-turn-helix (wHTH) protein